MKIKKRPKINRLLAIPTLAVLAGIAVFFVYSHINNPISPGADINRPAEIITSDKQQSDKLSKDPAIKTEPPNADKPPSPTTNTNTKKQVQMTASVDISGGTVFIRGGINYHVISGSCYAQLSGPSGQSIRKDTTLLPNPASTDCKTISIPAGELTSGKWTFILHYTSGDYEGASNEISFSI